MRCSSAAALSCSADALGKYSMLNVRRYTECSSPKTTRGWGGRRRYQPPEPRPLRPAWCGDASPGERLGRSHTR
jgi:hypothetical protein